MKRALALLAACGGHDAAPDAMHDAAGPPVLVAYYAMDNDPNIEGAIDMGGHHLDGNCSIDECPTLVAGHLGMAYHFDGVMQHLRTILDDHGRPMIFINWNTDMGDGWEWSNALEYPGYLKYTAMAYRMGINEIVYALTH